MRNTDYAKEQFDFAAATLSLGRHSNEAQMIDKLMEATAGIAGGLMSLSSAVADLYDKLVAIEKRLPR